MERDADRRPGRRGRATALATTAVGAPAPAHATPADFLRHVHAADSQLLDIGNHTCSAVAAGNSVAAVTDMAEIILATRGYSAHKAGLLVHYSLADLCAPNL